MRALGVLGLADQVVERSVHIRRQRTADHRGRLLFEVDVDELWDGVGPCLALPRADLHRVLLAGIGDLPVGWARTPRAINLDPGGVTVDLGEDRRERYDLVLGADGGHSAVRHLVLDSAPVRAVAQYARRFVAPAHDGAEQAGAEEEGTWSVLLGAGSAVLTIPVGPGQVYCYCDGPLRDPPPLRDLLAGYAEPVPALLDALDRLGGESAAQAGPVEEVVLDSWSQGAVLLIGDAAHATSPNMAQGAAMALEDVGVLAESLAAAGGRARGADRVRAPSPAPNRLGPRPDPPPRPRPHPALVIRSAVLCRIGGRIFHANYRPLREPP